PFPTRRSSDLYRLTEYSYPLLNTTISPFLSSVSPTGLTAIKLPSGIILSIESPFTLRTIMPLLPAHLPIIESGIDILPASVIASTFNGSPRDIVLGWYVYVLGVL